MSTKPLILCLYLHGPLVVNVPSVHRKSIATIVPTFYVSRLIVLTFVSGATRSSYTYTCPKFKMVVLWVV